MIKKENWNVYQNDYRRNHYAQLSAYLDPSLVIPFKDKLKKEGLSYTSFLRSAISEYLEKK